MPTRQQWINSLNRKRLVTVDSSLALIGSVRRIPRTKSFRGQPKRISSVPRFQNPLQISVSPIELLFSLGRITTPRIQNLMDLATTWAVMRYIWAFDLDLNKNNLVLSQYGKRLDPHQKAVLSDDFGVAFSDLIVRRYLHGIRPQPISIALQLQNPIGISRHYSTSPDYIYQLRGGGYIVAECKGTTTTRQASIKQLGRGQEQVPSIFIGRRRVDGFVIGACLMGNQTIVHVIDPPGDDDIAYDYFIRDEKKFNTRLEILNAITLLRYAGLDELSNKVISESQLFKDDLIFERNVEIVTRENNYGNFVGLISPNYYLGNNLNARIFKGIFSNIHAGFKKSIEEGKQHIGDFYKNIISKNILPSNNEETGGLFSIDEKNSVSIISENGAIMSIEINEI